MAIKKVSTGIAIALLCLSGCQGETLDWEEAEDELPQGFVSCPEQRPEACIQIFQPVCALVDTGVRCVTSPCPTEEWQTRGNSCTACSDAQVIGYIEGECVADGLDTSE
jgi:hypothetical protein